MFLEVASQTAHSSPDRLISQDYFGAMASLSWWVKCCIGKYIPLYKINTSMPVHGRNLIVLYSTTEYGII